MLSETHNNKCLVWGATPSANGRWLGLRLWVPPMVSGSTPSLGFPGESGLRAVALTPGGLFSHFARTGRWSSLGGGRWDTPCHTKTGQVLKLR